VTKNAASSFPDLSKTGGALSFGAFQGHKNFVSRTNKKLAKNPDEIIQSKIELIVGGISLKLPFELQADRTCKEDKSIEGFKLKPI
jgi:hypothetical protein